MRTMEEIRKSNEETLAAFDCAIAARKALLHQYQELNQQSSMLNVLIASPASRTTRKLIKDS